MYCTVPETFYFPIFAFAHHSLTVRSPSVHRPFSVRSPFTHTSLTMRSACVHHSLTFHNSAFTVQRALAFTVHKAFIVRSPCVQLSFTKRSSFSKRSAIFMRNSNVKGSFLKQWQNKDGTCVEWWVKTFSVYQKFHC